MGVHAVTASYHQTQLLRCVAIARAEIVNGSCFEGSRVNGHLVKAVLWALWAMQLEGGPERHITVQQLADVVGCGRSAAWRAMEVLRRDGMVSHALPPERRGRRGGTAYSIHWERLAELVPARNRSSAA